MSLSLYYQNARGLRTKTIDFLRNVLNSDYDFICITETWLVPGIFDSELFDSRYSVYRTDRNCEAMGVTRGGGTLIAVRRELRADASAAPVAALPDAEITHIVVPIGQGSVTKKLRLFVSYFPQGRQQADSQLSFFESLSDLYTDFPDDEFLVIGDFNISDAAWVQSDPASQALKLDNPNFNCLTMQLAAFMHFCNWQQFNYIPNKNGRQLDLVLSNCKCEVNLADPLVPIDTHHPVFYVTIDTVSIERHLTPARRIVRRFYAADYEKINSNLNEVDWESHLSNKDIETAVDCFYTIVNKIINDLVPSKSISNSNNKYPVWFSYSLIRLIKKKNKIHKKWKIYKRLTDYEVFSSLRSQVKTLEVSCYNLFISRAENNIKLNSKLFWSFIKSKTDRHHTGLPDTLHLDGRLAHDGHDMANLFNEFFQSVFEPATSSASYIEPNYNVSVNATNAISNVNINLSLVEKYLNKLNESKGSGPDGIHPIFLKRCSGTLALPVCLLFNHSLRSGILPKVWKQSIIVPIFKKGDKHDIKNYRGISKLSVLPKLFEKIICDTLYPTLRPMLITQQHGFLDKRSIETNLCEYLDYITNAMDGNYQVDAIYTDYSKAFDKISHSILLKKIEHFGIHGDLLRWLTSYLRDRTQAVTVKGFTSTFVPITSGVPQGSHLGPLLFNVFINDVINCFSHSNILLYADDTKIFTVIKSEIDSLKLQEDLDRLNSYCINNLLYLNVDKCSVITFTRKKDPIVFNYKIGNEMLKRVYEIKDLGVHLDSEIQLTSHIEKITAKAFRMLGFIFRQSKDFRNPNTLLLLYNAFVRSNLDYASIIWSPFYSVHINSVERIQKKFLNRLKYKFKSITFNNIESLQMRREKRDVMFLYKLLNNIVDSQYLVSKVSFRCINLRNRSTDLFSIPFSRKKYVNNKYLARTCKIYNKKYSHIDMFQSNQQKFVSVLKDNKE